MIPLPPGWMESKPSQKKSGVLAWIFYNQKRIEYYPRWWTPDFIMRWVHNHERAHAWGIRECLSGSWTCLMFEDDDSWRGKIVNAFWWIIGRGRFCKKCREFLDKTIK